MTTPHAAMRPVAGAAEGSGAAEKNRAAEGSGAGAQGAEPSGPDELIVPEPALVAARAADEKLGQDTMVLAMGDLFGVVDAFVVTSGRNLRQVRTLVEEIERQVKAHAGRSPSSVEGLRDRTWVLLDYGDFLVHVFLEETRAYYDLEHLWSGAPRVRWQDGPPGSS